MTIKLVYFLATLIVSVSFLGVSAGKAMEAQATRKPTIAELKILLGKGKKCPWLGGLMVDMQVDFCEGGALPVKGADETWIEFMNQQVGALRKIVRLTVFTGDHHPAGHVSFADKSKGEIPYETVVRVDYHGGGSYDQLKWPVHCVASSEGARLVVKPHEADVFWPKGMDPMAECYSAARDELGRDTGFVAKLREMGITTVIVGGLAADYCVSATMKDLARAGIHVVILTDWTHWVDSSKRESIIAAWKADGILVTTSSELGLSA